MLDVRYLQVSCASLGQRVFVEALLIVEIQRDKEAGHGSIVQVKKR